MHVLSLNLTLPLWPSTFFTSEPRPQVFNIWQLPSCVTVLFDNVVLSLYVLPVQKTHSFVSPSTTHPFPGIHLIIGFSATAVVFVPVSELTYDV